MADATDRKRSDVMRQVRSKHTKPELVVRRLLFSLGYRFRIHYKALPGSPDIAFTRRRKVIMINGCFWHGHNPQFCTRARTPKTRQDYWIPKLIRNRERDQVNIQQLESMGWTVEIIWECELKDIASLEYRLINFLGPPINNN